MNKQRIKELKKLLIKAKLEQKISGINIYSDWIKSTEEELNQNEGK